MEKEEQKCDKTTNDSNIVSMASKPNSVMLTEEFKGLNSE